MDYILLSQAQTAKRGGVVPAMVHCAVPKFFNYISFYVERAHLISFYAKVFRPEVITRIIYPC